MRTLTLRDVQRAAGNRKSWTMKFGLGGDSWEATGRGPRQPVEVVVQDSAGARFEIHTYVDFMKEASTLINLCLWVPEPCDFRRIRQATLDLFYQTKAVQAVAPPTIPVPTTLPPLVPFGQPHGIAKLFPGAAEMVVKGSSFEVYDGAGHSLGIATQVQAQELARTYKVGIRGLA